mgnify:CR=1 FL=1
MTELQWTITIKTTIVIVHCFLFTTSIIKKIIFYHYTIFPRFLSKVAFNSKIYIHLYKRTNQLKETHAAYMAWQCARAATLQNVESFNLQTLEREAIKRAISLSNGNLTQAAEMLGITRFALYRNTHMRLLATVFARPSKGRRAKACAWLLYSVLQKL